MYLYVSSLHFSYERQCILFIFVKIVIFVEHIRTLDKIVSSLRGGGSKVEFGPHQYGRHVVCIRHVRLVLKGTADINPSLPVMPPFRQRLFPRQHASEYPQTIRK